MSEQYRFFDSVDGEDERVYTADEFAEYFRKVISTGILNGGENLKVNASGTDMNILINEGYAWIEGYLYKIDIEPLNIILDSADPVLDRIDRIIIRLDKSLEKRYVRAFVLKGEPDLVPIPPKITRNKNIYEISLAQVKIIAGKSFIHDSEITDERLNTNVCGMANSLITADTTEIFNQFQSWYNLKTSEYEDDWLEWSTTHKTDFEQWVAAHKTNYENEWSIWWNNNPVEYITQWLDWWIENPVDYEAQWIDWFSKQQTEGFTLSKEILLLDDIKDTIQTPTYDSEDQVIKIEHKRGAVVLRTDTFTYSNTLIIESRILNTGDSLKFNHHFDIDGNFIKTEVI